MGLYDDTLRNNPRYQAAHRLGNGRGDPWASGHRRRLSVEPKRADSIMLWLAIGCIAVTVILKLIGAL